MTHRPATTSAPRAVRQRGLPLLAGFLVAFSAAVVIVGIADAWIRDRDGDMQKRVAEYALYRDGIYPNREVDIIPVGRRPVYSVYPPWALPMFSVFFEPGGKLQGRIVLEILSVGALATMGWYGWKRLRPRGVPIAVIAATAGAAIAGNASGFSIGQFSILCMGFVAAEMALLEKGMPIAAGVCWALAMLKPQIGIAFAPLLMVHGNRTGFAAGLAVLFGLSLLACAWTDVAPSAILEHWLVKSRLDFNGHAVLQNTVESWTGLSQRVLLALGLLAVALVAGAALAVARRAGNVDPLRLAAPLAVVGMLAVYHRHYDNVMLWPTMLAAVERAAETRGKIDVAVAATLGVTLLMHQRFVAMVPYGQVVVVAVWVFAAWRLVLPTCPASFRLEGSA